MNRTLTYIITENDIPNTIQSFLQDKGYSSQVIKELKKMPESILIDGRWEYMRHSLTSGETLTVRIQEAESSEKIPAVAMDLDIVYEDEDIMVINKPADMPIHPSLNNYYNSLANGLAWYFEQQGKPFIFRCVNRLDRDTSGLTIIAKHMLSAGILSTMVTNREIHREYLAIVPGKVTPAAGTIDAPIGRVGDSIIERHVDYEKGDRAVTHYQLLEYKNGHSLLSIHLETGRTHQIRVHMKHIGFPLAGDYLYNPEYARTVADSLHNPNGDRSVADSLHNPNGDRSVADSLHNPNGDRSVAGFPEPSAAEELSPGNVSHTDFCHTALITRQALHSHRLHFIHPITRREMEFISPLPRDMASLMM